MTALPADIPYAELAGAAVVVGMSGGVDSSVTAALLQQAGLRVTGLFMKNWEEDDTPAFCAAAQDRADAERVCAQLGVPFTTVNFAAEYWDRVFAVFLREYRAGRTPNPDILCNREIKFKTFFAYARDHLHADYIATGHYCRRSFGPGPAHLLKGSDPDKDQSYFLHAVPGETFARVLFPVGGYLKTEVRALARRLHLPTADKKDSTGICFIGEKRFTAFLHRFLPSAPGDICTPDGTVVGRHDGLMTATVGQRRGLHLGGRADGNGEPWYVVGKDLPRNRLIVAQGHSHPARYAAGLRAADPRWVTAAPPAGALTCKIRYRQPDVPCTLAYDDGGLTVRFATPQVGIAPGQAVVFYRGDDCLGGAVITAALPPA